MTIDINNIKPGDRIVAEFEVEDTHAGGVGIVWVRSPKIDFAQSWVIPEHIIEHKPKPVELKIGDTFPPTAGFDGFWTILGIDDDTIWAKYSKSGSYSIYTRKEVLNRMDQK